ncbi:MAG TPA: hypothetical protein VHU81_15405 [Thermoanaerobaculia bacterium]|nr:hypothetical protein [Thermoanaerobaculia bacterium]
MKSGSWTPQEVISDVTHAPVRDELRRTLLFLGKLNDTPEEVTPDDIWELRAAGVPGRAIEDAIYICTAYNIVDRLADAFGFQLPPQQELHRTARFLLKIGYKV